MSVDINRLLKNRPRPCGRGAPLGDQSRVSSETAPMYLQRVRFIDGDYGADGTYWGSGGDPVWAAFTPCLGNLIYTRAPNRDSALRHIKTQFPQSQFKKP